MPRPRSFDKESFLKALGDVGAITRAARITGHGRRTVHQHLRDDPEFRHTLKRTCAEIEERRGGHEFRQFREALKQLRQQFPRFRHFLDETSEEFHFRFDHLPAKDREKVIGAIRLGHRDLRALEKATYIPLDALKELLAQMEKLGEIRREKEQRVGNKSGRTKWLYVEADRCRTGQS